MAFSSRPSAQRLPFRSLAYGRQSIEPDDIAAVVEVLGSEWLTTGPCVEAFEEAFANAVFSTHAVAVSSGTAALHAAMYATEIGPGDEVIVPPMTFAATANAVLFQGGTPVFADVHPGTLLVDAAQVERGITSRTKAIVAVDYAGQPCDYAALRDIATRHGLRLIADACHALGAEFAGKRVGSLADLNVFSFHPVKHITTGEGGMVATNHPELANRLRLFRNHGISTDHRQRAERGSWFYEMVDLGFNYRITDFQCALGRSQLKKLDSFIRRRRAIAKRYDEAFQNGPVRPLERSSDANHAYHLYVVKIGKDRDGVFSALRAQGVGANVHYIPVHLHPYYRVRFGFAAGLCPVAEDAFEHILSLPIYPAMTEEDVDYVVQTLREIVN